MATNDFRLTSIFKIIVRICMKNVDLDEKALNQQLCLMKYVYNEISNSTSHKKNKTKQNKTKQSHNPTKNISKTSEKFLLD